MFGSGISFSGLASGLDSGSIIEKLVQLESIPISQLEKKKKEHQAKLSDLGTLKGYVKELQKQAKTLSSLNDFLVYAVTPSQEGVASFSATGSAAAGSHTLEVLQLASIDRWAFDGVSDATVDLATGAGQSVSFTAGGTAYSIAVDQAASSLEEIAAAINEEAGEDVEASVVNAGTESNPSWKLVLTAEASGEDARISGLTSSIAGLSIDGTGPDSNGVAQSANNLVVGANALAVVDGLTVERTTNELDGVLTGVSIDLESLTAGQPIQFSISADEEAIQAKLKSFVDSYNKVVGFIRDQSTYSEEGGPGGKLFGDSLLSAVRNTLGKALFSVDLDTVMNDTEGYSTLNLVGIEVQSDGSLLIDQAVLGEKLAGDLAAFADLFVDADGFDNGGAEPNTPGYYTDTTADSGLAATLYREIDRMFKTFSGPNGTTFKGLFDTRNEAINKQIADIDDDIESKKFYLERFQANLVQKFAKLEDVMAGLQAQGAALQSALNGLI